MKGKKNMKKNAMSGLEIQNFYEMDTKEYDIDQNQEFLALFEIFRNYDRDFNKEKIKHFMEKIVCFYEFKYPNEMFNGTSQDSEEYKRMLEITKLMDVKQLEFRIHHDAKGVLINDYWDYFKIEIKRDETKYPYRNKEEYYFRVKEGIVKSNFPSFKKEIAFENEKTTPEEFYSILEQSDKVMDYSELKRILEAKHYTNLMKKKILELTALKMLYSENTLPIYAYPRIKYFIKEFNETYDIDLDCQRIDEIMNIDYQTTDIDTLKRKLNSKKHD